MVAIESARASILDALGLQREAAGVAFGGSFTTSSDGQVIESTDPPTGEVLARVRAAAVPGWAGRSRCCAATASSGSPRSRRLLVSIAIQPLFHEITNDTEAGG
jgi:hypothetical protein